MLALLLAAALPFDLGVSTALRNPGPPGLEVRLTVGEGRYAIVHTWRGAKPMRFVTGATDLNCDEPVDVLLIDGKERQLFGEKPCGGFAFRAAREVKPGESWTIAGTLPVDKRGAMGARYCVGEAELKMVAPVVRKPAEPPWWLGCAETSESSSTVTASRATSPWNGLTSNHEEEQRGMTVAATTILPAYEITERLRAYAVGGEQAIATDRAGRRVVLNQRWFGEIKRVDGTTLPAGERHTLGVVKSLPWPARTLARFVVEAELVKTYAHLESTLTVVDEEDSPARYRARFEGKHVYYTNARHEQPVRFAIELDKKSGRLDVVGR